MSREAGSATGLGRGVEKLTAAEKLAAVVSRGVLVCVIVAFAWGAATADREADEPGKATGVAPAQHEVSISSLRGNNLGEMGHCATSGTEGERTNPAASASPCKNCSVVRSVEAPVSSR